MAITPGPGYMVDPNNPNAVVPIGSTAQAQGLGTYNQGGTNTSNISYGAVNTNPAPSSGVISRTSSPPAPQPAPLGSPQLSTQLAQQAQSLGVQNVPQSLLTPTPQQTPSQPPQQNPNSYTQSTVQSTGINPNVGSLGTSQPSFSNIVQGLSNTSAQGSPVAAQASTGLLNTAQNQSQYQQALSAYQSAVDQYQNLQSKIATQFGNLETSDQALPVVLGTEGALQKQYAAQLDAAQNAVSSASNALNAANTAVGNTITAQTNAGNIGNTAQSTAQSGLSQAGQLAQPSGTYPFVFNPATGSFTTSGTAGGTSGNIGLTLNPSTDISAAVSAITANPSSYSSWESAITSGYGSNGSTIAGQLNAALLQAGLNPTNLAAESTQSASNVSTAGGAQSTAWNSVLQSATSNISTYSTALNNINTLGGSAGTLLATLPSGAASNPQLLNSTINGLATQFNSPQYAQFNAMIAGLQRAVSGYISQGEIPTNATQSAQAIVNPNTTVQALLGALTGFNSDMQAAISANQTTATAAQKQLNQAASTNPSGGSGTSSTGTGWGSITYGTQ